MKAGPVRKYTVEFRETAVKQVIDGGRGISAVARLTAYFSPSWTTFQDERGRDFSVIVDGISN